MLTANGRAQFLSADSPTPYFDQEITWRERSGLVIGGLLAVVTGSVSRIRRARMFHPDGVLYSAHVYSVAVRPDLDLLGNRLAGPALVRFSSAWWRGGKSLPDVLGVAVRFLDQEPLSIEPRPGDQDLLFATIRFPWTTPFAPLATRFTTFLWNHYHAVSPFDVGNAGRVKFRLRSPRLANSEAAPRAQHLRQTVATGHARWVLEVRRLDRFVLLRRWEPVAELVLEGPVELDQAALRFSPFRVGRGLRPVGFVHALRVAAYAASQRARPRHESVGRSGC